MIDTLRLFSPKAAIRADNREHFAGRRKDLAFALDALAVPESALALIGEGGVGKTSLAWQVKDILTGRTELLKRLDVGPLLNHTLKKYYCVWVKCGQEILDLETLLASIIKESSEDTSLYAQFPKAFKDPKIQEEVKRQYQFTIGVAKASAEFKSNAINDDQRIGAAIRESDWRSRVHWLFQEVLSRIRKHYSDRELVIFLDDFNRIPKRDGLGHLIKDIDIARFVIIAVADDVHDIIAERPGRKLEGSHQRLEPLTQTEVNQILDRAEMIYPGSLAFSDEYRTALYEQSEGYPWLVQMIGYHSVLGYSRLASQKTPVVLAASDVRVGTNAVASPSGDDYRYEMLKRAVGTSANRERILFALADISYGWIEKNTLKKAVGDLPRLEQQLQALEVEGVVKRDKNGRIRFAEPILRALVRFAKQRGSILVSDHDAAS